MYKKILFAMCCLSLLSSIAAHAASFLKADGQFIVNEQGEKVLLRGTGLGGWMLQEGYMLKLNEVGHANYYISTGGKRQPWNRGTVYRNDGVDIYEDKNAPEKYIVGNVEAGEWLEYTINAEQAGKYSLSALLAGDEQNSTIEVVLNNTVEGSASIVAAKNWQEKTLLTVRLQDGANKLRIKNVSGNYQLARLSFVSAE